MEVGEIGALLEKFEASLPKLGLPHAFPIDLLGLALPVILQVRLTDYGLVDVVTQEVLPVTVT
jgi:adenine deaminase